MKDLLTKEIKKENYFEKFCSSLTDLFYLVTKEARKTKGKISVSAFFLKKISDKCLFGLIVFALPSLENLCALFTVMKFSPFNTVLGWAGLGRLEFMNFLHFK